jgi:exopolyphosphatase/guanosine-5'-triphosphate,3'-diphosphate pyrophosphatase
LKLAAIDIGSNAIRFQVSSVLESGKNVLFKKLEYIRFPLRLGRDVFTEGRISEAGKARFRKLMKAYKLLIELYEVDDYMICATSAMREAQNGQELADEIREELRLSIEIIDGNREAELINRAIQSFLTDKTYLHIDVGGGSTELNLYTGGEKVKTQSFRIGSVRVLEGSDSPDTWKEIEAWIRREVKRDYGKVTAVGTGGNISKMFDIARLRPGKTLSITKLREQRDQVAALSLNDRIYKMQMNPDRADVIIPATDIYLRVMEWAHATSILVPDVGLKDGMMLSMFDRRRK